MFLDRIVLVTICLLACFDNSSLKLRMSTTLVQVHDVNTQVVGVGLTTTCLLMNERIPLTVPNSLLLDLWIHDQVGHLLFNFRCNAGKAYNSMHFTLLTSCLSQLV